MAAKDCMSDQRPPLKTESPGGISVLELFCGTGRLSDAFAKKGFMAVGIDKARCRHIPLSPRVYLDLTLAQSVDLVTETLRCDPSIALVWLSPPSGSLSRARENPIKGGGGYPPLRSTSHPQGLPELKADDRIRVTKENAMVDKVSQVVAACAILGVEWAIQHPWRSFLWQLLSLDSSATTEAHSSEFPACAFGGNSKRRTRVLTSLAAVAHNLCRECPGGHVHRKWTQRWASPSTALHAAKEEAFTSSFCEVVVNACREVLTRRQGLTQEGPTMTSLLAASSVPVPKKSLHLRAAAGAQPRGLMAPLVQQHRHVLQLRTTMKEASYVKGLGILDIATACGGASLPPGAKVVQINSLSGGKTGSDDEVPAEIHVTIPWSPTQFIDEASKIVHPFLSFQTARELPLRSIFSTLTVGPSATVHHWKLTLLKWRLKAKQLEQQERALRMKLHPWVSQVLGNKKLLLFRTLLQESGFPNANGLFELLSAGVPMFGPFPETGIFPKVTREATKTLEQLAASSRWVQPAACGATQASSDPSTDNEVYRLTVEECAEGKALGPVSPAWIQRELGSDWVPSRRFGIVQGDKVRQIDDCSVYGHNETSATSETIDVQGVDGIFGLAKAWAQAFDPSSRSVSVPLPDHEPLRGKLHSDWTPQGLALVGRNLDLKKAYKQLPADPGQARFAVTSVWNPCKSRPELFVLLAVAFGAKNAVLAFNWCARALEHLLTGPLRLIMVSYFDDFAHLAPAGLQEAARSTAEEALSILGWEFKEGAPFADIFTSLGVVFDLRESSDHGVISVTNKAERADRVDEVFSQCKKAGFVSAATAASLRGQLQFASAQIFANCGGPHLKELGAIAAGAGVAWSSRCDSLRRYWRDFLSGAPPRRLPSRGSPPLTLIFTDGAAEGEGRSLVTVGGLLVCSDGSRRYFGSKVPRYIVERWQAGGKKQVVGQAELLPALIARVVWAPLLTNCFCVHFIDSDAARGALVRRYSPVIVSNQLVALTWTLDASLSCHSWYERVPGKSNPADAPSRLEWDDPVLRSARRDEVSWAAEAFQELGVSTDATDRAI